MNFGSKRAVWIVFVFALLLAAGCVAVWNPPPRAFHRTESAAMAKATPIGSAECIVCHEDVQGHAPIDANHADCETCHGNGSVHGDTQAVADIRFPSNDDCLACHQEGRTTHTSWSTGQHEQAGLLCSDCHNLHNREPHHVRQVKAVSFPHMDADSSLCVSCHAEIGSRLDLPSHHPVREGMLSCTDCHSPHEDTRTRLGDRVALCAECHQDHVGPWIYEHAPATEDCTTCHNPHGAPSFNLLDTSEPTLCISCHSLPDNRHFNQSVSGVPGLTPITGDGPTGTSAITPGVAGVFYNQCTNCHGAIHGSYRDPHLRR